LLNKPILRSFIEDPKKISEIKFPQFSKLLGQCKEIFEKETRLLELKIDNPKEEVFVIGDIHGNLDSLLKIIKIIKKRDPKYVIFLGDLVDRGPHQLDCLVIILSLKILEPERFYLLRGNHETIEMNTYYGFYYEFLQRFMESPDSKEFGTYSESDGRMFSDVLSVWLVLPFCAILNDTFLFLHGGIPEDINILNKLKGLKPDDINDNIAESIERGVFQMMWNDPEPRTKFFDKSYRGAGIKIFGEKAFNKFMETNNLKYLIRSHECFPKGFKWFFDDRLLTVFSSSNYRPGLYNPATYAIIKKNKIFLKELRLK
jgi:hypothetical protein